MTFTTGVDHILSGGAELGYGVKAKGAAPACPVAHLRTSAPHVFCFEQEIARSAARITPADSCDLSFVGDGTGLAKRV